MKHRYVVQTYVDAETIEDAIRLAKRMKPHEVYLHADAWKDQGYAIKDQPKTKLGYATQVRPAVQS